jgi:hypothetical protein
MNGDDLMVVYSNYQGNDNQIQAMFDHEQFPDLTETMKSDNSVESANAGGSKAWMNQKKAKQSKPSKSL